MPSKYDNRELGTFAHFEHVNYRVPDHHLATIFFMEGLGFTRDPTRMVGVRNMWVNAGQQQFHLPIGEAAPFAGEVGITVPKLSQTLRDLKAAGRKLKGSRFAVDREGSTLRIVSPWGHVLRAHEAGELSGRLAQAIPYVRFAVPAGSADTIGQFYREVLSVPVTLTGRRHARTATVTVGVNQAFHFEDTRDLELAAHPNHVAVYITGYRSIYDRLKRQKLLMAPDRNEQFRFAKMADPDTGEVVFEFEHEMRSLHHPDYLKPLINRVDVPYLVD